jgi:starch synthase (maltosyl-transferring)
VTLAEVFMQNGRKRIVIEGVQPQVDCGHFPAKRVVGDSVVVEADVFADGHDLLSVALRHRHEDEQEWHGSFMTPLVNDRWRGSFIVERMGRHCFTLQAWVDAFKTWQRDLQTRRQAGQDLSVELLIGAQILENAASPLREKAVVGQASPHLAPAGGTILRNASLLRSPDVSLEDKIEAALDPELDDIVSRCAPREHVTCYQELWLTADPPKARFSTWYEIFPRSASPQEGRHGTFKDLEARLPYVKSMGFDVLYLPPVHPIGKSYRKGKNNQPSARPEEPGSPWAIGGREGGHKSLHPQLGSMDDFRSLIRKAGDFGIEIALDLAFQCSPDHPYVQEHPQWFRWRPDGTVQYAENPPKKYEDIYPFNFESDAWPSLWQELKSIALFWIQQGVRIFRVDNPHTKPLAFWEWLIPEVKKEYPDVIFLSEAFTRPKIMYRLAKLGFTQSYTYFAWRNNKHELTEYLTELTSPPVKEFFGPNFWPNTPDILTEYLQHGGRPAFQARLVLAATLSASYGIYGPAFELLEHAPRERGSEEYMDSEKYQVRHWDLSQPHSLKDFIARVNEARRDNPALQSNENLLFHPIQNDQVLFFSKHTNDLSNVVLVAVNLDPYRFQSGWVDLPLARLGLDARSPFQVHDLLSDARYTWHGPRNYIGLDPKVSPAHVFRVRRRVGGEKDFEHYQ